MTAPRHRLIGAGFNFFSATGLHRLLAPITRGQGAILTFHRVRPAVSSPFAPNALLEITPGFLDQVLSTATGLGYRFIGLDEVPLRLRAAGGDPFLALTFDDGYRDTLTEALPVLEKHDAPFTVFATTGFLDRTARLWWVELEEAVRRLDGVQIDIGGERLAFETGSVTQKQQAFARLRLRLLALDDPELLRVMDRLCAQAGFGAEGIVSDLCMDWDELGQLLAGPLATLGCHTVTHPRLALCSDVSLRAELDDARRALERRYERSVRHFCFPYGMASAAGPREFVEAEALGFATAVTTRPGVLRAGHAAQLTALPRISVNGLWQSTAAVEVLLSGAPFALWNGGRSSRF